VLLIISRNQAKYDLHADQCRRTCGSSRFPYQHYLGGKID